jgi:probable rRNA maturation factor
MLLNPRFLSGSEIGQSHCGLLSILSFRHDTKIGGFAVSLNYPNFAGIPYSKRIMPARFYEQGVRSRLKERRRLSAFLDTLMRKHRKGLGQVRLSYIFCTDEYLLEINKQFLNHDTFTDIITFDLSETSDTIEGEIYISTERVAENATVFQTSYNRELHRVIFHGALHLCGYRDKKKGEKEEMRRQEEAALKLYGV